MALTFSIDICNLALLPQTPSIAVITVGVVLLVIMLTIIVWTLRTIYCRCPTVDAYMILLGNMSTGILAHDALLLSVTLMPMLSIPELVASIVLVLAEYLLVLPVLGSLILIHIERFSFICNGIAYSHQFWRHVAIVGAIIPWVLAFAAASFAVLFSNGNCRYTHVLPVGVAIVCFAVLTVTNICIQKTNRRLLRFDMHLLLRQHAWIGRHRTQVNTVCEQQIIQPIPSDPNNKGRGHSVFSIPLEQKHVSVCSIDYSVGSRTRSGALHRDSIFGVPVRSPTQWSIHTTIGASRGHTRHSIEQDASQMGLSIRINSLKSPSCTTLDTNSMSQYDFNYPDPSTHDESDGGIWESLSLKSPKLRKISKNQRPGRVAGMKDTVKSHLAKTYSRSTPNSPSNLSVIQSTGENASLNDSNTSSVHHGMNIYRKFSLPKDYGARNRLRQAYHSNWSKRLPKINSGSTHISTHISNRNLAAEYSRYGQDILNEINLFQTRRALSANKDRPSLEIPNPPGNQRKMSEAIKSTRNITVYDFLKEEAVVNNVTSDGNDIEVQRSHSIGNKSQHSGIDSDERSSSLDSNEGSIHVDKDCKDHVNIEDSFRRKHCGNIRVCLAIVLCLLQGLPVFTSMVSVDLQVVAILTPIIGIAHVLYYVRAHRSLFQRWKRCFGFTDNVINVLPWQNDDNLWQ